MILINVRKKSGGHEVEYEAAGTIETPDNLLAEDPEFVVKLCVSGTELEALKSLTTGLPLPSYPNGKTARFYGDLAKTAFDLCRETLLDYKVS